MDRDRVGRYISPYYDNEMKLINRIYDGKNESKIREKLLGLWFQAANGRRSYQDNLINQL